MARKAMGARVRTRITADSGATGVGLYDIVPIRLNGVLYGVNIDGLFAGQDQTASGETHAITATRTGDVRDLGTLGGSASSARGLNNHGVVVGGSLAEGDEEYRAFVYASGMMRDLNELIDDPSWYLVHALGINDRGEIIAVGHHDDVDCTVLLVPRTLRSPPRRR